MNKIILHSLRICLILWGILLVTLCYGQTTIWVGTAGGGDGFSWTDGDNWDSGLVPTFFDDVIIDNGDFVEINTAGQEAASVSLDGSGLGIYATGQTIFNLELDNGSTVEIDAPEQLVATVVISNGSNLDIFSGDLTIDNDYICDGVILANDGALNISDGATLNIYNTDESSIYIPLGTGIIDNAGTIFMDRTTPIPLFAFGTQGVFVDEDAAIDLTNQATGIIKNLDTLFADFIYVEDIALATSTIINHGLMDVSFPGSDPDGGFFAFFFRNTTTLDNYGTIKIDSTEGEGIVMLENSRLTNHTTGNLQMKLIDEVGIGMAGDATLINDGTIEMDSVDQRGFNLFQDAVITNNGTIKMDSLANRGFKLHGAAAVINKSLIQMQDIGGTSINLDDAATFTNDSVLIITQNAGDANFQSEEGIDLDDGTTVFTNNGTITITGTEGSESIDIDGQFINNCLINVGISNDSTDVIGVNSNGVLTNNACGIINITTADSIDNDMGQILNGGIITTPFAGVNGNTGTFLNNGILVSPNVPFSVSMPLSGIGTGVERMGSTPAEKKIITGIDTVVCANEAFNLCELRVKSH